MECVLLSLCQRLRYNEVVVLASLCRSYRQLILHHTYQKDWPFHHILSIFTESHVRNKLLERYICEHEAKINKKIPLLKPEDLAAARKEFRGPLGLLWHERTVKICRTNCYPGSAVLDQLLWPKITNLEKASKEPSRKAAERLGNKWELDWPLNKMVKLLPELRYGNNLIAKVVFGRIHFNRVVEMLLHETETTICSLHYPSCEEQIRDHQMRDKHACDKHARDKHARDKHARGDEFPETSGEGGDSTICYYDLSRAVIQTRERWIYYQRVEDYVDKLYASYLRHVMLASGGVRPGLVGYKPVYETVFSPRINREKLGLLSQGLF
ncbi:hypothetical protein GNI_090790 [Gregarina niphandrodes]|uniref:F-box domain-containing protein n=1 Tax=Gregarina niphandrodes TaxID=110365 RepID=A0A023B5E3_GRENI|nr:hypothetical protein GNI_090790 [Gregarina niphandrodes]EZG60236.1 hypothetical protein GNI_090790 [Gregarina niphandrodes]|eukprot:XP_011130839.1 hypothetical protein GNI_090790 [Gregarina niphandrodes]